MNEFAIQPTNNHDHLIVIFDFVIYLQVMQAYHNEWIQFDKRSDARTLSSLVDHKLLLQYVFKITYYCTFQRSLTRKGLG